MANKNIGQALLDLLVLPGHVVPYHFLSEAFHFVSYTQPRLYCYLSFMKR